MNIVARVQLTFEMLTSKIAISLFTHAILSYVQKFFYCIDLSKGSYYYYVYT